jgi:hypothetical protein
MVRLPRPRDHCAAGAGAVHAISFQSATRVTLSSRVKPLTPRKIKQVVHMTLHESPPKATHWSVRRWTFPTAAYSGSGARTG